MSQHSEQATISDLEEIEARGRSQGHLARAWSRLIRKRLAVVCVAVLAIVYLVGIFAPVLAPYKYTDQDYKALKQPPSVQHWAGTDLKGRDILTRTMWAIQNTIVITFVAMATGGLVIGVTLGLISGYFGRRVDSLIMRVGEVFSSFPDILLMILLAATIGPRVKDSVRWLEDNTFLDGLVSIGIADYFVISLALVSFGWIGMARLVRGQVLALKETQYVEAAQSVGASTPRILFVHLLPNAISPIVVSVTMGMGAVVGAEIILRLPRTRHPAPASKPRHHALRSRQHQRSQGRPLDAAHTGHRRLDARTLLEPARRLPQRRPQPTNQIA